MSDSKQKAKAPKVVLWDGVRVRRGPSPKMRLAELQARAPVKRHKPRPFAKLYLDAAGPALAALNCRKAMVWVWLVHRAWKHRSPTISIPNGELSKLGISRDLKSRALQQLEAAGVISVDRRPRKTPLVTIL